MFPHTVPDQAEVEKNKTKEPEGEVIRAALIEFLEKYKIARLVLDTATHSVEVRIATLPPKIKNVLSIYGSIYVVDDAPNCLECGRDTRHHASTCSKAWTPTTRPEDWNDNVIPPMTHPLSSAWKQPDTSDIIIDNDNAYMSKEIFDELMEYSATNPSGAYEGKMWKRHDGVYDRAYLAKGGKPGWMLCWFGYSLKGLGYVQNLHRTIILTDGEVLK